MIKIDLAWDQRCRLDRLAEALELPGPQTLDRVIDMGLFQCEELIRDLARARKSHPSARSAVDDLGETIAELDRRRSSQPPEAPKAS